MINLTDWSQTSLCPTVLAILQAAVKSSQELNQNTVAPVLTEVTDIYNIPLSFISVMTSPNKPSDVMKRFPVFQLYDILHQLQPGINVTMTLKNITKV